MRRRKGGICSRWKKRRDYSLRELTAELDGDDVVIMYILAMAMFENRLRTCSVTWSPLPIIVVDRRWVPASAAGYTTSRAWWTDA